MKLFYIIAVIVTIALVASPFLLLRQTGEDPFAGKIVNFNSYYSAIRSIDPATCGDTMSAKVQGNIYDGLYTYHFLKRPAHSSVMPQLAAEMPEVSADGLTYLIKLRDDILYHRNPCFGVETDKDGKPQTDENGKTRYKTRTVEAKDFVLAFRRVADYHLNTGLAWAFTERIKGLKEFRKKTKRMKIGDFSRYDFPIEGVQAVDKHTLKITLDEPYPQFIYVLTMNVYAPIPREQVEYWLGTEDDKKGGRRKIRLIKRTTEFREAEQVVGTGPYLLTTFKRKIRVIMERNPDFREEYYPTEGEPGDAELGLLDDENKRVRLPFIDVLYYDFVPELSSDWMLFLFKQHDAAPIPTDMFKSIVTPDKELESEWRDKGIRMTVYKQPEIYWIVFNMEDPVLGTCKSLRQGLCASFDVDSYMQVLKEGRGIRAVNTLPSSFKGWKEAGPGPYYKLDLDLARKKLAEAKKELGEKGLLENGEIPELTIDIGGRDALANTQAELFKQQFAKVGIRLKTVMNDWSTQQAKVNNKQSQMYTMGWHADYPDAENFLQLYYTGNIEKQTNNSNYSNPVFDKLYEKVRVMPDTPERTALYAKMTRIISEDCPHLLLDEPDRFVLYYDWYHNVKPHPVAYGFSKYRRIDPKRRRQLGGKEK